MKLSRIAAAVSLIATALISVHAEEYQGVLQFRSTLSRSDVRAQAVDAARGPNPYADAASSMVAGTLASPRDRAVVQSEARAHAHRPNQNLRVEAFAGSRVPSYYDIGKGRGLRQPEDGENSALR